MLSKDRDRINLLAFYSGDGCDHQGRTFDEILHWDNDTLEHVHDYIQWLFPLAVPSRFNANAPLLTPTDIRQFKHTPQLQESLHKAFELMLGFYGFELNGDAVRRGANFQQRAGCWLKLGNHNMLRITRILTSLTILGSRDYAANFLEELRVVHSENPSAVGSSHKFWEDAIDVKAE